MNTREETLSTSLSKTFSCDQCKKVFSHSYKLRNHRRTHVDQESVTCDVCKKVFAHRPSLARHKQIHAGFRPFKCSYCTIKFTQRTHMIRHVKLIHKSGKQKMLIGGDCDVCGSSFKTAKGLKRHEKIHNPSKVLFHCEICTRSFVNASDLKQHQRQHAKPFACNVCKKSFSTTNRLSVHAVTHSNKLPHSCQYCGQQFRQKAHVRRHEKSAHMEDKSKELQESKLASVNEKETPKLDENKNEIDHISNHVSTDLHENDTRFEKLHADRKELISGEKDVQSSSHEPWQESEPISVKCECSDENNSVDENCESTACEISQKSDGQHSDKMESSCENSEKSPIDGGKEQIKAEPEVMANQCDICFKTFRQKSYVKSHRRTHTGEKPYRCECGKKYTFANRLKSHRESGKCSAELAQTSNAKKPVDFKCSHCYKVCKSRYLLKIHQKCHEKKAENLEAIQCRFCSRKFPSKESVERHEKIHKARTPYQCNLCDKTFKLAAHFANHKRGVHSKGKRRRNWTYSTTNGSKKQKTSSNEKRIVHNCEFCAKSFGRASQLLLHQETHKSNEEDSVSPGIFCFHDKDTEVPQPRTRETPERNLFTELKLRNRHPDKVVEQTNSNSKKYISEVSHFNSNNVEIWQNPRQQQQEESDFDRGNLLQKLDNEIDRLTADFLRSENADSGEQPLYQHSNTSLQGSMAENGSPSSSFETEEKRNSTKSRNESAEISENSDAEKEDVGPEMFDGISREKLENGEMREGVEGRNEKLFVCCECGEKFDKQNAMMEHCMNAH